MISETDIPRELATTDCNIGSGNHDERSSSAILTLFEASTSDDAVALG